MNMRRTLCVAFIALAIAGIAPMIPGVAQTALADGENTVQQAKLSGWQENKSCYYRNGVKVTGIQKIGKAHYFFNAKGKLKKGTFSSDGVTYYCDNKGKMEAYKKGSTFYKPTGKKMASYSAKEYKALLSARKQLRRIVSSGDSKSTQMYKCMKWVNKGYYEHYRSFYNKAGWTATYANDHFVKRVGGARQGDCVSDPCAFAYLCLAIGYTDVKIGVDAVYKDAHGVARINGKYYDPLFAEAKSWSSFYGYSSEYLEAIVTLKVPSYKNGYTTSSYSGKLPAGLSASSVEKGSKKNGLIESKGALYFYKNGKKVKSKWVTYDGATYYFDKKGKAVVGSVKLKKNGKKSYYVFGANGKLKTGKKTRVVKVNGVRYRVTAKGKAKCGWYGNGKGKKFYLENGARASGPCMVKGKLYVFSKSGALKSTETTSARKLLVRESPVGNLVKLLGTPGKVKTSASCFIMTKKLEDGSAVSMEGTDKCYVYDHLKLYTFVADGDGGDGQELHVCSCPLAIAAGVFGGIGDGDGKQGWKALGHCSSCSDHDDNRFFDGSRHPSQRFCR